MDILGGGYVYFVISNSSGAYLDMDFAGRKRVTSLVEKMGMIPQKISQELFRRKKLVPESITKRG